MIDKTKDCVRDAVLGTRRAIQERLPGSTRGDIKFDKKTGVGRTSHSTDDVKIDIVVTPKSDGETS